MDSIGEILSALTVPEIVSRIQEAGVAGAGGAGFPSYVKWQSLDDIDHLLINHQESEPNYYADKWLGREHAREFTGFFSALTATFLQSVVIGTKEKYRTDWMGPLEELLEPKLFTADDLPADINELASVNIAYTPDVYTYSEESVLLMVTVGQQIGDDLPTEHGWIVHNSETIFNIINAVISQSPVTRKFVHVDGNTPKHRCLDVPIGTTATTLLEEAGLEPGTIDSDEVLADGGPGWCYEITDAPHEFGVRKRTNAVLVLDESVADEHTEDDGQIDVLEAQSWERTHEESPTPIEPDSVRIPLITNAAYSGFVAPSEPIVSKGDSVSVGDRIAEPVPGEISNPQHASIPGVITDISDTHIEIHRE